MQQAWTHKIRAWVRARISNNTNTIALITSASPNARRAPEPHAFSIPFSRPTTVRVLTHGCTPNARARMQCIYGGMASSFSVVVSVVVYDTIVSFMIE